MPTPMSPESVAKIKPSLTDGAKRSKTFTYASTSSTCVICLRKIVGVPQSKDVPLCRSCYGRACEADMSATREYKFEPADHIIDNIYLGAEGATKDLKWLEQNKIDRVLTVASHSGHLKTFKKNNINYLQMDMEDSPTQDLAEPLTAALDFILSKPNTNVLVHSVSGNSRAGAIVVAYVMATHKIVYEKALLKVQAKRSSVQPNSGFVTQLKDYEGELKDRDVIPGSPPSSPLPEALTKSEGLPKLSQFYATSFTILLANRLKAQVRTRKP